MWINVRKPVLIEAGNNVCLPHVRERIVVSPPQTTVSPVGEVGARLLCRYGRASGEIRFRTLQILPSRCRKDDEKRLLERSLWVRYSSVTGPPTRVSLDVVHRRKTRKFSKVHAVNERSELVFIHDGLRPDTSVVCFFFPVTFPTNLLRPETSACGFR